MARYTFTCEHFNYNDFNGDEQNVAAKHTTEFRADTLETMLENFEMFLRGSGFVFDGVIDVVSVEDGSDCEEDLRAIDDFVAEQRSERVMNHIVNDLMTNPFKSKEQYEINLQGLNESTTVFGASDSDGQYSFNFDTMAGAQPTYTVNFDDQTEDFTIGGVNLDEINISLNEYCEVCNLPKSVMQSHKCYDEKCPIKVS
jgi:predicted  nucleic acid-binding Zn-ribbon protein